MVGPWWTPFTGTGMTLLACMCHAKPFSARALKKNYIFLDVDIVVKKQIDC